MQISLESWHVIMGIEIRHVPIKLNTCKIYTYEEYTNSIKSLIKNFKLFDTDCVKLIFHACGLSIGKPHSVLHCDRDPCTPQLPHPFVSYLSRFIFRCIFNWFPTECMNKRAGDIIKNQCEQKRVCVLEAAKHIFDNPCQHLLSYEEYLSVTYDCVRLEEGVVG